jgi:hypothetical protein
MSQKAKFFGQYEDAQNACKALNGAASLVTANDLEEVNFLQQYGRDLVRFNL